MYTPAMFLFVFLISLLSPSLALPSYDGRIVGGSDIDIKKVPYQVSLQINGEHQCGGSIIAPNFIITAAHCTSDEPTEALSIRVGTSVRESGGQVIQVKKNNVHPDWSIMTLNYDFAILELEEDIIYSDKVKPISLPEPFQTCPAGTDALVSGWGLLKESGDSLPVNLQGVLIQIVDQTACNRAYNNFITEQMLCAGVDNGGKGICTGDSGGPLQVDGILFGVVSFASGCAKTGSPGVFANVSALRDYIEEITGL